MKFSLKQFMPRTLFGRSLLILIAPILLIQVVTMIVFFDRHWSKMTTRLAYAVAGEISVMARTLEADPARLEEMSAYFSRNLSMLISFEPGGQLSQSGQKHHGYFLWEEIVGDKLAGEMRETVRRPFYLEMDFEEKWIEVSVQLENGLLSVSLPERRLFSSSGYIFLLWVFVTSALLLIVAVLFMRNQIRPIRKLAVAADLLGKGRDVPSFKPQGAREVRQAAEAFMAMRKRIKRQVDQRTAMLAGVSHDLRTPLTRLKLQLAMMGEGSDIDDMKDDIAHMDKMIEGYLDFARGEEGEKFRALQLYDLMEKVAATARRGGANIIMQEAGEPILMMLKPVAFERCLSNLIGNAARYSAHVWLGAHLAEDYVQIYVEDDGPGIPEALYEEVFKPFTRVDNSRNAETGGVGLGLPIAMDIVHSHGGKIWLEKSAHGGLKVVVRLPL